MEEIQRSRILRAMAEAVADQGAVSVTVADVVARAAVSRRTFYELFPDIEECFLATFDWGVERARVPASEAYISQSSWREGIRAGLEALLDFFEEETALAQLCLVHALSGGTRVLRRRAQVVGVLCEVVDRGRLESPTEREPPTVTAEGVVGAVLSIIHTRLLADSRAQDPLDAMIAAGETDPSGPSEAPPHAPLGELLGQLMSLVLLPYLGADAAHRELTRLAGRTLAARTGPPGSPGAAGSLVKDLGVRLTHRTACVLTAIAEHPGASNREIAERAGIVDQGQISKLLGRLESHGLIANTGEQASRGVRNAWRLTYRGEQFQRAGATRLDRERT